MTVSTFKCWIKGVKCCLPDQIPTLSYMLMHARHSLIDLLFSVKTNGLAKASPDCLHLRLPGQKKLVLISSSKTLVTITASP